MGGATPTADAERIAQLKEKLAAVARVLGVIGASYGASWSDFHGRTLEEQLASLRHALEAAEQLDPAVWLREHGFCPSCLDRDGYHDWGCNEAEAGA